MNAKEKQTIKNLIFLSLGLIAIYLLLGGYPSSVAFLGISGETMELAQKIFNAIRGVILFIIIVYWASNIYIKRNSQYDEDKARTEYHVLLALLILFIASFPVHLLIILLLPR